VEQLTIRNITIDIINKDIKNMHLAVYPPTGRVRIAAPLMIDEEAIRMFAISKLGWIKKHQNKFNEQERLTPREYKNRESHYFFGKRYLLNVIESDGAPKIVLRSKTYMDMYIKPDFLIIKRHELMNRWYREQIKKIVPEIIAKWERIMNVSVNEWRIKQMKTKWGSCNIRDKRIWLNLELAKKPLNCIEYVIVHEMIHFKEKHHNERFVNFMDLFLPNWKKIKKELNSFPASHAEWIY
jgi:predicted metal-dependent hydrolase